ncbi:hypothetical protein ACIQM3_10910 [Streptomyces sp. NPDC091271]|uniref:hypothetical protein n=1 Tax=Streptomyces sp. NPDC091271 TaxID=3365980 RepID=UPI00381BC02C
MTCYKPRERSRLFYAIREYQGRKNKPKGFGWKDFRDLVIRAHTQLGGPIVLVWDNPLRPNGGRGNLRGCSAATLAVALTEFGGHERRQCGPAGAAELPGLTEIAPRGRAADSPYHACANGLDGP